MRLIHEPFVVINGDDFYGQESFNVIADYYNNGGNQISMVAFRLDKTLSSHGAVTRGVCSIKSEKLSSVIETENIEKKENKIFAEGLYKFNKDRDYAKYKIDNSFNKLKSQFNVNLDLNEHFLIEILNYEKKEDKIANITAIFDFIDKEKKIKNINYQEGNNLILLNKIEINKNNQIKKFEKITFLTIYWAIFFFLQK